MIADDTTQEQRAEKKTLHILVPFASALARHTGTMSSARTLCSVFGRWKRLKNQSQHLVLGIRQKEKKYSDSFNMMMHQFVTNKVRNNGNSIMS